MSVNRLFWMSTRWSCPLAVERSSHPMRLMPPVECRTMLFVNVTSWTVDHGAVPFWFRGVNKMANPSWSACIQLFSKTLPSISARRAFFNSSRFLTLQRVPAYVGSPIRHDSGLKK